MKPLDTVITVNGEPYKLTLQNILEINRINTINDAIYVLQNYEDDITEEAKHLTEAELFDLGDDIAYEIHSHNGYDELYVLDRHGLLRED